MLTEDGFVINTKALGKMSDHEFYQFCQDNDHLRIERDANQNITIRSPTNPQMGLWNNRLSTVITNWCDANNQAVVFDSSTGFKFASQAVRSPDISVIEKQVWEDFSDQIKDGFPSLIPNFIIEIRSSSDNLIALKNKMQEYIENGVSVAWLIDPYQRIAIVYEKNMKPRTHQDFSLPLKGHDIMQGFEIVLDEVFK